MKYLEKLITVVLWSITIILLINDFGYVVIDPIAEWISKFFEPKHRKD